MLCKYCQVKEGSFAAFLSSDVDFAFGILTILVKHLCILTSDACSVPMRFASKLQVCHLFY